MENMNSILNQYFHFHFHFGNCFRSGECIIYPAVAHNSCYRLCKSCSNHFLWGYVKFSAALLGKIKLRFNVWNTFATRRTHTQMLRCFGFIFFSRFHALSAMCEWNVRKFCWVFLPNVYRRISSRHTPFRFTTFNMCIYVKFSQAVQN